MGEAAPKYQCRSCELRSTPTWSLVQTRARWWEVLCWGRPCCLWLARRFLTHFLGFAGTAFSQAGNTLHCSSRGLCCRRFPSQALIKASSAGWTGSPYARRRSHFTTGEFGLNTPGLGRVSHLNDLSGSSGCRCPPSPHSSIKGVFTFTGGRFPWERPRLRLTITNLSFSTLIPWSLSIIVPLHGIDHCFWILPPLVWYLKAVAIHINK